MYYSRIIKSLQKTLIGDFYSYDRLFDRTVIYLFYLFKVINRVKLIK